MEYREIVKESVIKKVNDATLDEVWNVYTIQKVPDTDLKKRKEKDRKISEDKIKNIWEGYKEGKRKAFR